MKTLLIVGASALALVSLSACASLSPFAVDNKAAPEAQKIQADAKAAIDKQFMQRLDHCTLTGQWSLGAGGVAVAGVSVGGGIQCPAQPWSNAPAIPPAATAEQLIGAAPPPTTPQ
jgi:hypothetical protein